MAHIHYSIPEYTNSPSNEKLLYISSTSYGKDWISVFHSHSFAELFYVIDGTGEFCTEEESVPIRKGSLIIINPNIRHTEKSSREHLLNYIVLGIDNLLFRFDQNGHSNYRVRDFHSQADAILPLLHMMLDEARTHLAFSETICQHYLHILLLKIQRTTGDAYSPYSAQKIPGECEFLKQYLDEHYQETVSLDVLAEQSHMSKYYLAHMFSKTFGISPINYLLERRILRSKELLKATDFTVIQIAHMTGFSSANYFSQSFKKYTGLSPAEYRKK